MYARGRQLSSDVLNQRAPQCDIDQLNTAADAQDRFAERRELLEKCDLVDIPNPVPRPLRFASLFAVARGAYIRAPLEHEPVEISGIVSETDRRALGRRWNEVNERPLGLYPARCGLFR